MLIIKGGNLSKNKINSKLITYGVLTSIIMWGIMLLGDFIDEMLIEQDLFACCIAFFSAFVITLYNILKRKSAKRIRKKVLKRYFMYILSYNLSFLLICRII